MSARITGTCALLTAWLAASSLAVAQDQFLKRADFEKWKETAFEQLKNQVSSHETQLAPLVPVTQQVESLRGRLDKVEPGVESLVQIAVDQDAKLGAIAKKVSQGGADTWVPDIRRAWENDEFRQDMQRAVHGSMGQQGTLWLHNKSTVGHTVIVNNNQHVYVGPGQDYAVRNLAVGTISTQLHGYESPRNWTLGPPNYEQHVDIIPNAPTSVVVARPVESTSTVTTVYSPPVYSPTVTTVYSPPVTTVYSPVYSPAVVVDPFVYVAPPLFVDPWFTWRPWWWW
jgi:hypothetical protein